MPVKSMGAIAFRPQATDRRDALGAMASRFLDVIAAEAADRV